MPYEIASRMQYVYITVGLLFILELVLLVPSEKAATFVFDVDTHDG